jgi:MOSC domain-containing protein YiiM
LQPVRRGLHHCQPLHGNSPTMNNHAAILEAPDVAASVRPVIRVNHLYISPGHNFVDHHGRPPGTHPAIEVEQIECVAGRGIRGDRYFDHEASYRGQITFFAAEVFTQLQSELGLPAAAPDAARRNVITQGIDLNTLVGREFEIQGVRFAGVEECRPCYWMNHGFGSGQAEAWLKGRGGLRARILSDGSLRRDLA